MSALNLARLRAFCEVADASSFTLAASRVFRTQPALSRQITELETYLGLRLFERQGRSVALTPAGEELYARARQLLGDTHEFEARARSLAQGDQGTLRVGAHPMLFERTVTSLLGAYAKQWGSINVTLSEGTAERLAMRVESRELDVAFARYMTSDALAAKRLFPMYLIAVVGPKHRFARRKSLEISLLRDEALLLMSADSGSRILLDQACQAEGLRLRNIRLESSSHLALISLAAAGEGVALLLSMASVDDPKARVIPVVQNGRHLGMWSSILWHRHCEPTTYTKDFIDLATNYMRENFPGKQFGFPVLDSVSERASPEAGDGSAS